MATLLQLVLDEPDRGSVIEVARQLADRDSRVTLDLDPRRRGKSRRQWEGCQRARYRRVLFLDARTELEPEAAGRLASPLDEETVAYTTGRIRYRGRDSQTRTSYFLNIASFGIGGLVDEPMLVEITTVAALP